jgi:hypothetical protein
MAVSMPTAAKAAGALTFAIVGWLVANAYIPGMLDARAAGNMREYNAIVGALVGWFVMGNSVGHKYIDAIGYGWKTVLVLACVALFTFGLVEMLKQSTRMTYDDPMEAIVDIFYRMYERASSALTVDVAVTMIIGGAVGGLVTENVSRRWP